MSGTDPVADVGREKCLGSRNRVRARVGGAAGPSSLQFFAGGGAEPRLGRAQGFRPNARSHAGEAQCRVEASSTMHCVLSAAGIAGTASVKSLRQARQVSGVTHVSMDFTRSLCAWLIHTTSTRQALPSGI